MSSHGYLVHMFQCSPGSAIPFCLYSHKVYLVHIQCIYTALVSLFLSQFSFISTPDLIPNPHPPTLVAGWNSGPVHGSTMGITDSVQNHIFYFCLLLCVNSCPLTQWVDQGDLELTGIPPVSDPQELVLKTPVTCPASELHVLKQYSNLQVSSHA